MRSLINKAEKNVQVIGWREWLALPELGITKIKAKIDTGARTSTLHAFAIEAKRQHGKHIVEFAVHPIQRRADIMVKCVAPIADIRWVTDSGGHRERRYIIETVVAAGEYRWSIEITLANRDSMRFRMLLGRAAIKNHFVVDPTASYLSSNKKGNKF